jgi:hypothetical protein
MKLANKIIKLLESKDLELDGLGRKARKELADLKKKHKSEDDFIKAAYDLAASVNKDPDDAEEALRRYFNEAKLDIKKMSDEDVLKLHYSLRSEIRSMENNGKGTSKSYYKKVDQKDNLADEIKRRGLKKLEVRRAKDDAILDLDQVKDGVKPQVQLKWREVAHQFAREYSGKNFPSTSIMGQAVYRHLKKRPDADRIREIQPKGNPKLWNKLGQNVLRHLKQQN